ncbi:MAG: LPXTG cell wall anchor domain-containing protein [Oscillospiraceae bacterium]|nr:LPXTG cell wall anchor domain-containing protein [Oscillospiraceae bacterium]
MPGLVKAANDYANTVATLRNVFLIGLAVIILVGILVYLKKRK